jgi:hypothetical protein
MEADSRSAFKFVSLSHTRRIFDVERANEKVVSGGLTTWIPHTQICPIHINPKPMVNDEPPEEEEVKEAVRKLNIGKAARATGIMAEHIKEWMNT